MEISSGKTVLSLLNYWADKVRVLLPLTPWFTSRLLMLLNQLYLWNRCSLVLSGILQTWTLALESKKDPHIIFSPIQHLSWTCLINLCCISRGSALQYVWYSCIFSLPAIPTDLFPSAIAFSMYSSPKSSHCSFSSNTFASSKPRLVWSRCYSFLNFLYHLPKQVCSPPSSVPGLRSPCPGSWCLLQCHPTVCSSDEWLGFCTPCFFLICKATKASCCKSLRHHDLEMQPGPASCSHRHWWPQPGCTRLWLRDLVLCEKRVWEYHMFHKILPGDWTSPEGPCSQVTGFWICTCIFLPCVIRSKASCLFNPATGFLNLVTQIPSSSLSMANFQKADLASGLDFAFNFLGEPAPLLLLTFLVQAQMLSLVAMWSCCLQVHVGPFPPISQHGEGHMMSIKPYCEPGVVVWPDFPKCCPANHPKMTCCLSSFWAVFLFPWCAACSSACTVWLLLKLQVAVLICTSQGVSLSCWCIILNDKSIKSAWLFLISIAVIFCGGVLSLLIN